MANEPNGVLKAVLQMKDLVKQSKLWQKHGAMIKQTLYEWVGPLGIVIGFSFKFLFGLQAIIKAADLVRQGLEAWSKVQLNIPSMQKMLGTMGAAKQRLAELVRMAASGPFKFDALLEANRRLHHLTRGAYAGKRAMEQVADAAAAAGVSPQAAAEAIGGVRDAIARGGNGAEQLRALGETGILSRSAAEELENLAKSGAGAEAVLAAMEDRLKANKGAAKALGDTLYGLSVQLVGQKEKQLAGVGELFSEAEAAGMRSGILMLKTLGPILVEILRPLATISTGLSKIGEVIAKLAALEPVKNILSAVLRILVAMSAVFAARGAWIFVRDLAPIAKMLGKMTAWMGRATGATHLLKMALLALAKSFYKTLGGGLGVVALLAAIAEAMGAFGKAKGGLEGDFLAKSSDEIKKDNERVRSMVEAGGSTAAKAETVLAAQKQVDVAKENERARKQKEGFNVPGAAVNTLIGGAMGRQFFGGGKVGIIMTALSAVAGLATSIYGEVNEEKEIKKAKEGRMAAQQNLNDAYAMNAVDPKDFLNDPDYARAKAQADREMADIKIKREAAEAMPEGPEKDAKIEKLNARMAEVANGLQPDRLAKAFNERMTVESARVAGMRAIAAATGDRGMAITADLKQNDMQRQAREKELVLGGMDKERAANVAKMESLAGLQEILLQKGKVIASSRAAVGGAIAEATGGIPPEFQKVIDEIRDIKNVLEDQTESYQVPEELK